MFPFAYPSPTGAGSAFASVCLLMNFDGVDASTTLVDLSSFAHTLTADGAAQLDTAQSYFGTASLLLNGSTSDCDCSSVLNLNSASSVTPFTIECFVRFASVAGDQAICGAFNAPTGFLWRMTGGSLDWFNGIGSGAEFSYATWNPTTGVWYYVCIDFDGTKSRMYTDDGAGNAVMRASHTHSQGIGPLVGVISWAVGAQAGGGLAGRYFNGWIDEYRYTNGIAQYASDAGYPVPVAAFPTS